MKISLAVMIPLIALMLGSCSEGPVAGNDLIWVTGFTPESGPVGTVITISGSGFGTSAEEITVLMRDTPLAIKSVTPERIEATIPEGATSGIVIVLRNGTMLSREDNTGRSERLFTVQQPARPAYSSFEFSLGGLTATHASYYERHMPDRSGHDTLTQPYATSGTVQCGSSACRFRTGDTLELSISNENVPAGSMLTTLKQVTIVPDSATGRLRYLNYLKRSSQQTGTTTRTYGQHNLSESFTIRDVPYQKLPDGSLRCTLDAASLAAAGLTVNDSEYTTTVDGAWGTRDLYERRVIGIDIPAGASLTLTLKP